MGGGGGSTSGGILFELVCHVGVRVAVWRRGRPTTEGECGFSYSPPLALVPPLVCTGENDSFPDLHPPRLTLNETGKSIYNLNYLCQVPYFKIRQRCVRTQEEVYLIEPKTPLDRVYSYHGIMSVSFFHDGSC